MKAVYLPLHSFLDYKAATRHCEFHGHQTGNKITSIITYLYFLFLFFFLLCVCGGGVAALPQLFNFIVYFEPTSLFPNAFLYGFPLVFHWLTMETARSPQLLTDEVYYHIRLKLQFVCFVWINFRSAFDI